MNHTTTIPAQDLEVFNQLREHGDMPKLSAYTGVSKTKLYEILKTGECSPRIKAKITKFFMERQNEINNESDQD